MDQNQDVRYRAYLLRLWQVKDQGRLVWRASLENAHSHERLGFGTLDELFAFLRQQADALPDTSGIDEAEDD